MAFSTVPLFEVFFNIDFSSPVSEKINQETEAHTSDSREPPDAEGRQKLVGL